MVTRNNLNTYIVPTAANEVTRPAQPAFLEIAAAQTNITGDGTTYTIIYTTETFDQNNDFDGTSTFTAPVTGRYCFDVIISVQSLNSSHSLLNLDLVATSRTIRLISINPWAIQYGNGGQLSGRCLVDMSATDTATVQVAVSNSTKVVDLIATETAFAGYLVC